MSRREDRGSDTKRHHRISGFDREPSPKRSRRDDDVERGRAPVDNESDKDRAAKDVKQHRRYEDVKALEASFVNHESKVETGTVRKESERENDVYEEGIRRVSDPSKVSRPRSFFQHDDRAGVGQRGRSLTRREDRGRGWWRDSREQQIGREEFKTTSSNGQLKDERTREKKEDNRSWRHDGYFELEANPNQEHSMRRRPAFREKNFFSDPEKNYKTASDPATANPRNHDVRTGHKDYTAHNRSLERDRERNRTEAWNGARERFNGGDGRYRGRDRYFGGQSYRSSGNRVEKWKHDLYNEANRSPTPTNEEDQIAKVEALLSL